MKTLLEGRAPTRVVLQLGVRARAWRRQLRPTTRVGECPSTKFDDSSGSYMEQPSSNWAAASMRCMTESTGVTSCGGHGSASEATEARLAWMESR